MPDRFIDAYLPAEVPGYPCDSAPRFSTTINIADSGAEQANRNWLHPLWRYTLPEAVREWETVELIKSHWLVMGGPAQTWPFRDPMDFASCDLEMVPQITMPPISALDQIIGIGNGAANSFQLTKTYQSGVAPPYDRPIDLPIVSSVLIAVNGIDVSMSNPWTVSRPGGVVTFSTAPAGSAVITAGFLFDVEVRFEADDSYASIVHNYNAGGFADLTLLGVRSC
jgi:uncharacterized protein (TIGR02217 family)